MYSFHVRVLKISEISLRIDKKAIFLLKRRIYVKTEKKCFYFKLTQKLSLRIYFQKIRNCKFFAREIFKNFGFYGNKVWHQLFNVKGLFLSEIHSSFQMKDEFRMILDHGWSKSGWTKISNFSCYDMNCETNLFQNYYFWRVRKKIQK